jgi:hypothetical protein
VALVRRVEEVKGSATGSDPLEYQGKRIVPSLFTALEAGTKPSVFFRVYPDRASDVKPRLRAQFLLDGHLLSDQVAELPAADASGSIPVLIQVAAKPGSHELILTVSQAGGSSTEQIRYSIAAK